MDLAFFVELSSRSVVVRVAISPFAAYNGGRLRMPASAGRQLNMNAPKRQLIISTLALAVCACVLSGPAQAQDTTGNTGTTAGADQRTDTTRNDDNPDYGWLGLLGLAGLAGLMKKPQQTIVHDARSTTNHSSDRVE